MVNKQKIKDHVLEYIKRNPDTTFVEIEELFEKYNFKYKGKGAYSSGENKNVIFWTGWNKKAFDVLAELKREGYIVMNVSTSYIYVIDGKGLDLPVLNKLSDAKHDCWLPITFSANVLKLA